MFKKFIFLFFTISMCSNAYGLQDHNFSPKPQINNQHKTLEWGLTSVANCIFYPVVGSAIGLASGSGIGAAVGATVEKFDTAIDLDGNPDSFMRIPLVIFDPLSGAFIGGAFGVLSGAVLGLGFALVNSYLKFEF